MSLETENAALRGDIEVLQKRVKELEKEHDMSMEWCQHISGMNNQCEYSPALGVWEVCPDYGRCPYTTLRSGCDE